MLIGHYGASLLAGRAGPRLRISLLFLAAQTLDIVWCVLVLAGVEHLRIVPGITRTNALDLQSMPFSHSLPAALLWGCLSAAAGHWLLRLKPLPAALLGVIVSGHWGLDWLVHRPDLLLWPGHPRVGLALWNYAAPAFLLETGLLVSGVGLYLHQTSARSKAGVCGMPLLSVFLIAMQAFVFFGPVPMTARETVSWALTGYIAFPAIAALLETQRAPRLTSSGSRPSHRRLPWLVSGSARLP